MEIVWPATSLPEPELVRQLDALRNTLTRESANKLCFQLGCGYLLKFVESDTLDYENGMAAYIRLLISIAKMVDRGIFMNLFVKRHGGCAAAQFFCMVNLHSRLADDVFDLFRVLLNDNEGEIVTKQEILSMARIMRSEYKGADYPFPYMALCLNFKETTQKMMEKLGDLFQGDQFGLAMETDRAKCIEFVKKYFSGTNTVQLYEFLQTLKPTKTSTE
jgi:hypothetical protein